MSIPHARRTLVVVKEGNGAPITSRAPRQDKRCVIVNADDFGRTDAVNRGIIEAHQNGIVTSASIMVSYSAATAAAAYAREHTALSVGLHLDVYEWCYREGEWRAVYQRIDAANIKAIRAELDRQLALFHELIGRAPTHLDSHQHAHMSEPIKSVVLDYARQNGLPLRGCDERIAFCGSFYGQTAEGEPVPEGITPEQLMRTLESLPTGWTEVGCHPGYTGDWATDYSAEREQELRTLRDPRLRARLANAQIALCSFHDFARATRLPAAV